MTTKKFSLSVEGRLAEEIDTLAGRLTYKMPEPRVPVSLEQAATLALERGLEALKGDVIVRTPVYNDGPINDPSEAFRPSRRSK